MSSIKTKEATSAPAQTAAPKKSKFVFQHYQDNTGPVDQSRIDDLLADDFDQSEWQFGWIRFDRLDWAQKRYYQVIRRDTHEHWFKPDVFDPVHNVIGRGQGNLSIAMNGIPEVYLCVREREAQQEEQRQMSEFSAQRLQDDPKLTEIKERMGNVVGTGSVFGGVSMNRSSWGADIRTK